MGRNLGPLNIKDSYEGLVQISGSQLTDGSGSLIPSLDVSASFATTATSASNADKIDIQGTSVNLDLTIPTFDPVVGVGYNSLLANSSLNYNPSTGILTAPNFEGTASFATTATNAVSASIADSATTAVLATTASHAIFADTASFLPADTNLNINSITASNASFTSASIGYLQTITGSAKIIGDAFIILNNNTPTERYAGLVVQDSGSTNNTASLEFDGQTNDWFYEYTDDGGATVDHGVAMFGPEYNTKGAPVYNTANTLVKGDGGHHLLDSSISDDGTLVTINANVSASGYVSASAFIGDGSQITGLVTDPFPYTGSADITGSLNVIGNASIGGENNTISSTGDYNVILNDSGSISGTTSHSFIAASGFEGVNTISAGLRNAIIAGRGNTITGGAETGAIIAGLSNTINASSGVRQAVIIGSRDSSITGGSFYGQAIIGARSGTLSGQNAVLIGGQSNTISGESAGIFAGYNHNVSGTTSAAVGGRSATVSHTDSVVLGGDGLSTTKTQEAVVNHLSIYGDTLVDDGTNTGTLITNVGQTAASSEDAVNTIIHLTQAEYDALTPDANTLYVIDGAETLGDTNVDGKLTGTVNTISDSGGTTALDCSVGNYFTLAMPAGGSTVLTPSNITAGQTINIKITQNATAATLTYAASIDFPGGTAFTISTGSGEVDVLTLVSFDGTTLQATGLANFS